jgi:hypothetical protein
MAGSYIRWAGSWWYRDSGGTWSAVTSMRAGGDPRPRDLTDAPPDVPPILERLYADIDRPGFPERLKLGLRLPSPANAAAIAEAEARRPRP